MSFVLGKILKFDIERCRIRLESPLSAPVGAEILLEADYEGETERAIVKVDRAHAERGLLDCVLWWPLSPEITDVRVKLHEGGPL